MFKCAGPVDLVQGGEYVALESMEATYAQSVFVNGRNGGIMCYADGDMDKPIALVQVWMGLGPWWRVSFALCFRRDGG